MKKLEYNINISPSGEWRAPTRVREEVNKAFWREGESCYVQMSFLGIDKHRTSDQNAYYWAVVIPMVTAGFILAGNELRIGSYKDYDIVHDMMKERFIPEGDMVFFDKKGDRYSRKMKTTTALNTVAFNKYLKDVRDWAFDCLGVYIPDPNANVLVSDENGVVIEITVDQFLNSVKMKENNV